MDRIYVFKDRIGFYADYSQTKDARRIFESYDSVVLALPFSRGSDPVSVVADVLKRNPNTIVSFTDCSN
jgi:hypothetical protein